MISEATSNVARPSPDVIDEMPLNGHSIDAANARKLFDSLHGGNC